MHMLRSRFPFIITLVILTLTSMGCSEEDHRVYTQQYESELIATEIDYEFVAFKVKRTLTVEDSLKEEMTKAQQMYDRFAEKLDNEMGQSQSIFIANQDEKALQMAKEHLRSMERFDSIRSVYAQQIEGLKKDKNKVIQKEAVHRYKSNNTLKELVLRFDGKDQLIYKSTPRVVTQKAN